MGKRFRSLALRLVLHVTNLGRLARFGFVIGLSLASASASTFGDELSPLKTNKSFIEEALTLEHADRGATFALADIVKISFATDWNSEVALQPAPASNRIAADGSDILAFRLKELGLDQIKIQPPPLGALTPLQQCGVLNVEFKVSLQFVERSRTNQPVLLGALTTNISRQWNDELSMSTPCDPVHLKTVGSSSLIKLFAPSENSGEEIMAAIEPALVDAIDQIALHLALENQDAMRRIHDWADGR